MYKRGECEGDFLIDQDEADRMNIELPACFCDRLQNRMTEDLREFLVIATVMNGMSSSCCKSETVQRQTLQLRCRTFPVP